MDIQEAQRLKHQIDSAIKEFFKYKYNETDCEMILEDLIQMIINEYIVKAYFCLYDENSLRGVVFSFDYSGSRNSDVDVNEKIDFNNFKLQSGTEKLLILELSNEFVNLSEERKNKIISERKNIWNFLGSQDIKIPSNQNIYYLSEGIKIKYGLINE